MIIILITILYINRAPIKRIIKGFLPVVVLKDAPSKEGINIIFFHHSTGRVIWDGGVLDWFENFRKNHNKNYYIVEQEFPKVRGNYPFDYWDIWVNHKGENAYDDDPTLEMITKRYDVVIWKHCFPVIDILPDVSAPDIKSDQRRLENYKLQYDALKAKMREFPHIKFIVWTGAVKVKSIIDKERATRGREFFEWVKNEWDESGDNIYLWDFYELETEGDIYLQARFAMGPEDSHPNASFATSVSKLLCHRIINVIEENGDHASLTGKK